MTDFGQYCCHDSLSELLPIVWGRDPENDDICLTENEKAGILLVTTNRHAGPHAGNYKHTG